MRYVVSLSFPSSIAISPSSSPWSIKGNRLWVIQLHFFFKANQFAGSSFFSLLFSCSFWYFQYSWDGRSNKLVQQQANCLNLALFSLCESSLSLPVVSLGFLQHWSKKNYQMFLFLRISTVFYHPLLYPRSGCQKKTSSCDCLCQVLVHFLFLLLARPHPHTGEPLEIEARQKRHISCELNTLNCLPDCLALRFLQTIKITRRFLIFLFC